MIIGKSNSQTIDLYCCLIKHKLYPAAILSVRANSDLHLYPYDHVILDTVNPELEANVNNSPVDFSRFERFGHLSLCPSVEFLGWSAEE